MLSRRRMLSFGFATATAGLMGCRKVVNTGAIREGLRTAPEDDPLLSLPPGFSYTIIQRAGDIMSDGRPMPMQPDGMVCQVDADGNYVLLRNHELGHDEWIERGGLDPAMLRIGRDDIDATQPLGGVSRLVLHPRRLATELRRGQPDGSRAVLDSRLVLSGTALNCSGGAVDGGWVTCEESEAPGHGWAYRIHFTDTELVDRDERRLPSWGRFEREGIALDPRTGIVYQTEDDKLGALYRHVPDDPSRPFGPGRLQALRIPHVVHSDRHSDHGQTMDPVHDPLVPGTAYRIEWVDLPDPAATEQMCRAQALEAGATLFSRSEGIIQDDMGQVWFSATTGGPAASGQLWRIDPANDTLTLVYEVTDPTVLSLPDNLTQTPWGDLLIAEDNYHTTDIVQHQHLRILDRDGRIYDLARNERTLPDDPSKPGAEFAGPCFSPDGRVLFVNLQFPEGVTVAITGPWPESRSLS